MFGVLGFPTKPPLEHILQASLFCFFVGILLTFLSCQC